MDSPIPSDLGAFVPEDEARVTHLRAAMARMIRASMAGDIEIQTWADLIVNLDPETRALAEADLELPEWVPIEAITSWVKAFASAQSRRSRGASLADQLLEHAHPWIQRALDPGLAVEALPRLFHHYHKGGVVRLLEVEKEHAVMDLWAFVPYPGWHDILIPSVVTRALERCGADKVKVRILPEKPGDPYYRHNYEIVWS